MKYLIILCLLFLPFVSNGQTQLYYQDNQILNSAVPSASPTATPAGSTRPLLLVGYTTYRVTVCPVTGDAITSGKIRLYLYNTGLGLWGYNPNLDITLSTSTTNLCQTFGYRIDVPQGYLLPATMNVVVSSGTTVTVRVDPGKN